jgi:hypothetical protein
MSLTTPPAAARGDSSPAAGASTAAEEMDTKADAPAEDKTPMASAPDKRCPNTVIIFDWDDTLLASTYLASKGYRLDTELPPPGPDADEVERQLKELSASVTGLLELALKYGHVHIVTNAETGWVQLSAQKFMPALVPMLSKVPVLSARSTFEPMHPEAPLKWKYFAFQEKIATIFPGMESIPPTAQKNIISFGDSHVEREAVRAVTRGMTWTRTKSVKFAERPSIEQLRRQVELVGNCFHYIHTHEGDLDLQLTVTVNATAPPPTDGAAAANGTTSTTETPEHEMESPPSPGGPTPAGASTPHGTDHMPADAVSGLPVDDLPLLPESAFTAGATGRTIENANALTEVSA